MPRPLYEKHRLRDKRLDVYLCEDELALIRDKAASAGLRPAAFVRAAALGIKLHAVSEVNAARWAELARTCANLNQLAHHANAGQLVDVSPDLLFSLYDEVQSLRQALLGVAE